MSSDALVRRMLATDIEMVLQWRNHPKIRQHMFNSSEIPIEAHRAWFARREHDEQGSLLIFELDGVPSGFVQLNERPGQNAGDWGFYTAPDAPKGTGKLLGHAALEQAFQVWGWHKVNGQTLASNERSIRMHHTLGFQLEGRFREHHFNGEAYVDVYGFGLLRSVWIGRESEK